MTAVTPADADLAKKCRKSELFLELLMTIKLNLIDFSRGKVFRKPVCDRKRAHFSLLQDPGTCTQIWSNAH